MGIRNKVTKDGFVSTLVDGNTGFFGIEQEVFAAGSGSVSTGLVVLSGSGVTAVLPALSAVASADGTTPDGLVVQFVLASANAFFLTASDPINGGAWTKNLVASQWNVVKAVGVSGLNGSVEGWAVVSGSVV
jgi:hypothetical protein